jgi:hypothetical protein
MFESLRRQLLLQLSSKPGDFAPEGDIVDFGRARVTPRGSGLRASRNGAWRTLEKLARHPDLRRVGDPGVGGARGVFGDVMRQDRPKAFVEIVPVGRDSGEDRKDKGDAGL